MSLAAPVSFAVTSGSLPPGTTLDSSGFFSGTPTTTGSYSFVITATGSDGQSTSRAYGITVAGIDQVVLAEAEIDEPYLEILTQTGMVGTVTWALTDGMLPAGITLDSDGVLEGTPTEDGEFPVEITITNGTDVCHRTFVLTVAAAQVQIYWTLEGPPNANVDSVSGQALFVNNFGSVLTSPPAKVGNGFQITGGFCNLSQATQALLYAGNGFTVAVWLNWVATGAVEGFQYSFCSAPIQNLTWTVNNTGNGTFDFVYNGASNITGPTVEPSAGAWHLVVFKYDPADGNLSMSVDGAAFVVLGNVPVVSVNPEPNPYLLLGNENVTYDEVGVYAFPFDAADLAYIWNLGNGRTFPLSFP